MRALSLAAIVAFAACGSEQPERSNVVAIAAGEGHTCALTVDGDVRCFGRNEFGQLGLGHTEPIGDDEWPIDGGPVPLATRAVAIAAGGHHSCAIDSAGELTCWGQNTFGQLGLGNTNHVGDDELPTRAVPLSGRVSDVAVGGLHTCALLETGAVHCFGDGTNGQLGYGNTDDIGDDEPASAAPIVSLGAGVNQLSAGALHTCSLEAGGAVRCWGRGEPPRASAPGGWGQLGYGNRDNIGDDETPLSAGTVDVGGVAVAIEAGDFHQCAVLEDNTVRCWGRGEGENNHGQLGLAMEENIGDDEPASAGGAIAIGAPASAVEAGDVHTCVITTERQLRCFGFGGFGQLGYGNRDNIGDDEFPDVAGDVPVGGAVLDVASGKFHTCALLEGGVVRCFGLAAAGEIGAASVQNVGDDEVPADVDPIVL